MGSTFYYGQKVHIYCCLQKWWDKHKMTTDYNYQFCYYPNAVRTGQSWITRVEINNQIILSLI